RSAVASGPEAVLRSPSLLAAALCCWRKLLIRTSATRSALAFAIRVAKGAAMTTITLRRFRKEWASRLDSLEARSAQLEQQAQRFAGPDAAPSRPSLARRATRMGRKIARASRSLHRSADGLEEIRRSPALAFGLRMTRAGIHDASRYVAAASAIL